MSFLHHFYNDKEVLSRETTCKDKGHDFTYPIMRMSQGVSCFIHLIIHRRRCGHV